MTRFQPPNHSVHLKNQQDLFQEFENSWENGNSPGLPSSELVAGSNGDRPPSITDDLEQEIERITAAVIALEEHANKGNGAAPELQQSVEQILQSCQGLAGQLNLSVAKNDQQSLQWLYQQSDRITAQIRESQTSDAVFEAVARILQSILQADRVLVYRFDGDEAGCVVAEALLTGWTPSLGETLPAVVFGPKARQQYLAQPVVAIADGQQAHLSPYQRQLFERFQIQSSLSCAIATGDQVWGLLVVQQCRQPRVWQPVEVGLVRLVAREVAIALHVNRTQAQAHSAEQWSQSSLQLIYRVTSRTLEMSREAISVERILGFTCRELRRQLQADRVAVYRFNADWSGQFVSEDKGGEWVPVVEAGSLLADRDSYLQETQGGRYRNNESFRVDDIYVMGHADCHIQILEEFQARAYVLAPIFSGPQLWGLLAVYQNTGPRQWQDRDVDLTMEVAAQLGLALQEASYARSLKLKIVREAFVSRIVDRIRQGAEMVDLSQFVCQDLRQVLECDRVAVYRFNPDWTGEFIAESVADPWISVLDLQTRNSRVVDNITDCSARDLAIDTLQISRLGDTYIRQTQGRALTDRNPFFRATADIYAENFSPCYIEVMEAYQVRAYVIGIIYQPTGKPWGMLAAYHCSVPRRWETSEIDLVVQVSNQLTIAARQAEDARNLSLALEREKAINKIVDRIRQKTDVVDIAQYICQELRQAIRCDRAAVYRFNPDWTGRFIAESVGSGWVSVMDLQNRNQLIMDNITECSTRDLAKPDSQNSLRADTQIRQTQGGTLRDNNPFYRLTNNIYQSNFSPCYIDALEAYEVKAYVIGIIYDKGGKPWGLLATYQCAAPRNWTSSEVDIVVQLSSQMSIAVQQAEYIKELEETSRQLAETADREKREREELQQQIIQILTSVRPALDGDLTVRAPVTENLVGTVADAYN
ncbi:MAG: GAF domain-containing protein, partial [Synechococcales bacterium]|nr:GAF domain-containing protein [Synechococcales bacterium]